MLHIPLKLILIYDKDSLSTVIKTKSRNLEGMILLGNFGIENYIVCAASELCKNYRKLKIGVKLIDQKGRLLSLLFE